MEKKEKQEDLARKQIYTHLHGLLARFVVLTIGTYASTQHTNQSAGHISTIDPGLVPKTRASRFAPSRP